jgi:hypothetical protein
VHARSYGVRYLFVAYLSPFFLLGATWVRDGSKENAQFYRAGKRSVVLCLEDMAFPLYGPLPMPRDGGFAAGETKLVEQVDGDIGEISG